MEKEPPFEQAKLEEICKILAATSDGLTGSEIESLLKQCRVEDTAPTLTKWKRLFNALGKHQNKQKTGNHVIAFIHKAMDPAKYVKNENLFENKRSKLNEILALCGYKINEEGKIKHSERAYTVNDALKRANELKAELKKRNVHTEVLTICEERYLKEDYFFAVFEAVKTMAERMRKLTNCYKDGQDLCNHIFGNDRGGKRETPIIAFNSMKKPTELDEHYGIVKIIRGIFSAFRNPQAHEQEIHWEIIKEDALDILSMISYIHRRLDKAIDIRQYQTEEQILKSRNT